MPRPIGFVKSHPVATIVLLGTGYVVVPFILGKLSSTTGVNINLPQPGGGG